MNDEFNNQDTVKVTLPENEGISENFVSIGPSPLLGCRRWKLPASREINPQDLKIIRRVNRSLEYRQNLIVKKISEGELEQAFRLMSRLFQTSRAFWVYALNIAVKDWYRNTSENKVKETLGKVKALARSWDTNPRYRRVYIPKADKIRFRPLGIPDLATRAINAMLTDFITMFIEKDLPSWSYGFRKGRHALHAWSDLVTRFKKKPNSRIYEFDLDACFNRISLTRTIQLLVDKGIPMEFCTYLENYLSMPPMIKDLKEETEVVRKEIDGKPKLWKRGLPQGFAMSPILCVMTIGEAFKSLRMNPVMYADDGVFVTERKNPPLMGLEQHLESYGLVLSKKLKKDGITPQTGFNSIVTFLGITWDSITDKILVNGKWIPRKFLKTSTIRGIIWKGYSDGKDSVKKEWEMRVDSIMMKLGFKEPIRWRLAWKWLWGHPHIQRKGFEFFDWRIESSKCSIWLLRNNTLKNRRLMKLHRKYPGGWDRVFMDHCKLIYTDEGVKKSTNSVFTVWERIEQTRRFKILGQTFGSLEQEEVLGLHLWEMDRLMEYDWEGPTETWPSLSDPWNPWRAMLQNTGIPPTKYAYGQIPTED